MQRGLMAVTVSVLFMGVGIVINHFFDKLLPLGCILIVLGLLGLYWKYEIGHRIMTWLRSTRARLSRKVEVWLFRHKVKTEEDWLDLVVEFIDLQKRAHLKEREIVIKFQLNSRLKYEFQPYQINVTPILNKYFPSKPEFSMTENLLPNRVSMWATKTIEIKDNRLWELVQSAREGKATSKALRVEIQPRLEVSPFVLEGEPQYEL